jgi:hypothetical protein
MAMLKRVKSYGMTLDLMFDKPAISWGQGFSEIHMEEISTWDQKP